MKSSLRHATIGFLATCFMIAAPHAFGGKPPGIGCSSINLVNNGHSVFGKNLDNNYTTGGLIFINKRGVEKMGEYASPTGARAHWVSKYSSINYSFVHVGLVWTGMNEKGLVISMMGIPEIEGPPPDERPPLEDGQWVEYMLDTCETVEEVLAAAAGFRIITVDHYHLADRYGGQAVIEHLAGVEHVYTGGDLPVSVLTNSTYGSSIQDWFRYQQNPYPPPNGSIERFRIAAGRIEAFHSTDPASAVDYAYATLSSIRSELINGYPNTTQWSFVFDTENLRSYFKTYSHPEIRYFDLHDFDLTCNTPTQMLDIQAELSGNVFPYFQDVTFEATCDHYRNFIEDWIGFPPDESHVVNEIGFYLSFPCSDPGITNPRRPGRRVGQLEFVDYSEAGLGWLE